MKNTTRTDAIPHQTQFELVRGSMASEEPARDKGGAIPPDVRAATDDSIAGTVGVASPTGACGAGASRTRPSISARPLKNWIPPKMIAPQAIVYVPPSWAAA